MKQLTAVSLFAGVGGFDLALERSGIKVVASVEIDPKASAILAKQFPNSKLFNDVKGVTGEQLINAGFDARNGIITGGFPCQDLSMAGKRAGLGGARSGLFWEICRLLDETKAQYFILENVPGLLSSNKGKDMAVVLEALVERGYCVAYRVLDAQYFGVPQRRRRVFIVGCLGNSGGSPEQILAIAEGRSRYIEASKQKRESITRKITKGFRSSEWWNGNDVADTLTVSSNEQRMPDKNKMQMIVFSPHREDGARVNENVVNTLLSSMGTGGNNMPMIAATLRSGGDGGVPSSRGENLVVAYPMHGAMIGAQDHNGPDGSGFLGKNDPSYTLTASSQNRHGVAIVFEPKSAFEENWAESTVKNALRANASKSSHAIVHNPSTFANYSEQEIVGTLRAGMPTGSEPLVQAYKKNIAEKDEEQWTETDVSRNISVYDNNHEARVTVLAETNSVVRRLTPLECERLQGFPDGWTQGQADQHRYKQMGNAVAVPVVEFIVKRLVEAANA
ncbi:MAG: DNA (cytosine-5-)-methyltransferase [Cyanobacteria bacterium REEB494]|nr:DNA (cytosine-5-)-methyltransferase [Cyanobacteria bacterium REEB494]